VRFVAVSRVVKPGLAARPDGLAAAPVMAAWRPGRALANGVVALAIWAAFALVTPTFLSAPIWLSSDAGVFYSVFHQLGQGRRLYVDVFDHKDPLFYAGHTLASMAAGPRGPMLWEAALSLLLLFAVLQLGARSGLGLIPRTLLALVFAAVHFLPPVYIPVHTYQQALALTATALWLAAAGRAGLAGAAFAGAVASKLTILALGPAFGLFVALAGPGGAARRDRLAWATLGAVATIGLIGGALYARGELAGYRDALTENLYYPPHNPAELSSFVDTPDLWGRVTTLFTTPLASAYLVLLTIAAGLALAVREPAPTAVPIRATAVLAVLAFGGALATLLVASWWAHHFAMAGLVLALALLPVLAFAGRARDGAEAPTIQLPGVPRPGRALGPRGALVVSLGVPLVVLGLIGPMLDSRVTPQPLGLKPYDPCTLLVSTYAPARAARPECGLLQEQWPAGTRFATVQGNDPGTLAAWTLPSTILACRVFYQFIWLEPALLDEAARCLAEEDVDVVLRAPLGGVNRPVHDRLVAVLRASYRLARRHGEIEVWLRRG
jgi:hypothetical protein